MSYLRESNINQNGLAHYNKFQTSKDKQPSVKDEVSTPFKASCQDFKAEIQSPIVKMSMVHTKTSTLE